MGTFRSTLKLVEAIKGSTFNVASGLGSKYVDFELNWADFNINWFWSGWIILMKSVLLTLGHSHLFLFFPTNFQSGITVKKEVFYSFLTIAKLFLLSITFTCSVCAISAKNIQCYLKTKVGGLRSPEEAFLLPTQQPQGRIPALRDFFSLRIFLFMFTAVSG